AVPALHFCLSPIPTPEPYKIRPSFPPAAFGPRLFPSPPLSFVVVVVVVVSTTAVFPIPRTQAGTVQNRRTPTAHRSLSRAHLNTRHTERILYTSLSLSRSTSPQSTALLAAPHQSRIRPSRQPEAQSRTRPRSPPPLTVHQPHNPSCCVGPPINH
ncbi:hypothetical protein DFJ77DRAFT_454288, partial [Powellomyces hirtus]